MQNDEVKLIEAETFRRFGIFFKGRANLGVIPILLNLTP